LQELSGISLKASSLLGTLKVETDKQPENLNLLIPHQLPKNTAFCA